MSTQVKGILTWALIAQPSVILTLILGNLKPGEAAKLLSLLPDGVDAAEKLLSPKQPSSSLPLRPFSKVKLGLIILLEKSKSLYDLWVSMTTEPIWTWYHPKNLLWERLSSLKLAKCYPPHWRCAISIVSQHGTAAAYLASLWFKSKSIKKEKAISIEHRHLGKAILNRPGIPL